MAITTKQSLSGFIATDPELTFTSKGDARLYVRIGQPQARLEDNGTYTDLGPTFADLVMFRKSAERAHEQFRKGDNFIAEGERRTYTNSEGAEREQFVASRIGHDNNITRYAVDRSRPDRDTPQHETPQRDTARQETAPDDTTTRDAQQALTDREAELTPDTPTSVSAEPMQREAVAR